MSEQAHILPEAPEEPTRQERDAALMLDLARIAKVLRPELMDGMREATRWPDYLQSDLEATDETSEEKTRLILPYEVAKVSMEVARTGIARRVVPTKEEDAELASRRDYREIRMPWNILPNDPVTYAEFLNRRLVLLALMRSGSKPTLKTVKGNP